ncbi:MAG: hypothetical protein LIO59_07055 [Oscillospiraceae bacterium]|nr:hypothetical protein [Oscillospiraceae bacterium]
MSDDAREQGYLSELKKNRHTDFPNETADIAEKLKSADFCNTVSGELETLINDYETDKSLIRFKYHKQKELFQAINELSIERTAYISELAEVPSVIPFITDDEINDCLMGGSSIEGGKGRIYEYFSESHTQQDKVEFLKREYGIGGHSNALSDSDESFEFHETKGIKFTKGDCTPIEMSWNSVSKRISELVRADRYFTPEAKEKYEESKRAEQLNGLHQEYFKVKNEHPTDIVLFQVGDFFEMLGDDARVAADILDIHTTSRQIEGAGKTDVCGIPAFLLETHVEQRREILHVTISAIDAQTNERGAYSLPRIMSAAEQEIVRKTEITQDDIEGAVQSWNGSIESKQRVNAYMLEHGRERGTAAWLANEYGGGDSLVVSYADLEPIQVPWTRVQRMLIQMVSEDIFLADNEREPEESLVFEEMTDEDKENFMQAIDMARDYGEDISDEDELLFERILEERENAHENTSEVADKPGEHVEDIENIGETDAEAFEYGGYHFKPVGTFLEKDDFFSFFPEYVGL